MGLQAGQDAPQYLRPDYLSAISKPVTVLRVQEIDRDSTSDLGTQRYSRSIRYIHNTHRDALVPRAIANAHVRGCLLRS